MATRTTIALVVALVMFAAPTVMDAHITTRPWIAPWAYDAKYTITLPPARYYWGWDCVTDEGQGRFVPCEMQ